MKDDIGIKSLIGLLNREKIEYCVIEYDQSIKNLELLVHLDSNRKFIKVMESNGYMNEGSSADKYAFIYRLEPDAFWTSSTGMKIHSACQISCVSLSNLSNCKLPLDNMIQLSVWQNKVWDETQQYWRISEEDYMIYVLVKCIFDQKKFDDKSVKWLVAHKDILESKTLSGKLEGVFFFFTPELIQCIKEEAFAEIIRRHRTFRRY